MGCDDGKSWIVVMWYGVGMGGGERLWFVLVDNAGDV